MCMLRTRGLMALIVCTALTAMLVPALDANGQVRRGMGDIWRGGSGSDCSSPITISDLPAALPFETSDSTAGKGNNYAATCLLDYDSGEDIIYEFTVTETICVRVTVEADTIWSGFAIANECTGFGSCIVVSASANAVEQVDVQLDPGTYYIIIDTFAPPASTAFDLTIEACPTGACCLPVETCVEVNLFACQDLTGLYQGDDVLCGSVSCPETLEGDNCLLPIVISSIPASLPFSDFNSTAGRGNNYVNTCLDSFDAGNDIVYELEIEEEVCLRIELESSTGFAGMALHNSCPIASSDCIAVSATFAALEVIEVELTPGVYFLQIDTFAPPQSMTFELKLLECLPFGGCCLLDGSCIETTNVDCADLGGSFLGDGIPCMILTCPDPEFGACCLPDDTCVEMFEDECFNEDGFFAGADSLCSETDCPLRPDNDLCVDAQTVNEGVTPFSTINATTDGPGHDDCLEFADDQINQDVWFTIQSPVTGEMVVSTCGSADFDTKMAIYQGQSCINADLENNLLACIDDPNDPFCGLQAELTVDVVAGVHYLIRVGGFDNEEGTGDLDIMFISTDCPGDANGDLVVNVQDLLIVISNWGTDGSTGGDLNNDDIVNVQDLLMVITNWGTTCDAS